MKECRNERLSLPHLTQFLAYLDPCQGFLLQLFRSFGGLKGTTQVTQDTHTGKHTQTEGQNNQKASGSHNSPSMLDD